MRSIKTFLCVLITTCVLFFAGDYIYSIVYEKILQHQESLSSEAASKRYVRSLVAAGRTKHPLYHHDLKPDFDGMASFGPLVYRLCTDKNGFKSDCSKEQGREKRKEFDIAFIGDSFTEAIALEYKDSFVGFFADNNKNLSIANLGVASYSPIIYYRKIKYLLDQGYKFKHVIVFPDISDIQDEAVYYAMLNDAVVDAPNAPKLPPIEEPKSLRRTFRLTAQAVDALQTLQNSFFAKPPLPYISQRSAWTFTDELPEYGDLGVSGGIQSALENMKKLSDLLRAHNIKFSLGVYPYELDFLTCFIQRLRTKHLVLWA